MKKLILLTVLSAFVCLSFGQQIEIIKKTTGVYRVVKVEKTDLGVIRANDSIPIEKMRDAFMTGSTYYNMATKFTLNKNNLWLTRNSYQQYTRIDFNPSKMEIRKQNITTRFPDNHVVSTEMVLILIAMIISLAAITLSIHRGIGNKMLSKFSYFFAYFTPLLAIFMASLIIHSLGVVINYDLSYNMMFALPQFLITAFLIFNNSFGDKRYIIFQIISFVLLLFAMKTITNDWGSILIYGGTTITLAIILNVLLMRAKRSK